MFSEFFESPTRIQELYDCPDGSLLEGFAQELFQAGYAQITARRHIRAAEHLIYWIGPKSRTVAALDCFADALGKAKGLFPFQAIYDRLYSRVSRPVRPRKGLLNLSNGASAILPEGL